MTRMLEAVLELALHAPGVMRRAERHAREITAAMRSIPQHRTTIVAGATTMQDLDHRAVDAGVTMTRMLDAVLDLALDAKGVMRRATPLARRIEAEYRSGAR